MEVVEAASAFEVSVYFSCIVIKLEKKILYGMWCSLLTAPRGTLKLPVFPEISDNVSLQLPTHFSFAWPDRFFRFSLRVCHHKEKWKK